MVGMNDFFKQVIFKSAAVGTLLAMSVSQAYSKVVDSDAFWQVAYEDDQWILQTQALDGSGDTLRVLYERETSNTRSSCKASALSFEHSQALSLEEVQSIRLTGYNLDLELVSEPAEKVELSYQVYKKLPIALQTANPLREALGGAKIMVNLKGQAPKEFAVMGLFQMISKLQRYCQTEPTKPLLKVKDTDADEFLGLVGQ